jgi:hypothetical protein
MIRLNLYHFKFGNKIFYVSTFILFSSLMEHAGILDHHSETDLYCLHKVFFSLMRKSVRTHVESWNLHKHRSLRHKSPSFVFKEALRALKKYSSNNNKRFTELRQVLPQIAICHLRLP